MSVSEMNVGQIRRSHVFMRAISYVVLITFASMTISPGAQAIAQTVENATASPPMETTGNPHADKLEKIKATLRDVRDKRADGQSIATEKAALRELRSQLKALDIQTLSEFDVVEQHIKDKSLSDVILQRHREAVQKFKEESAKTDSGLADIDTTSDDAVIAARSKALCDRLDGIQTKRSHQPLDPSNLPFRTPSNRVRTPKTKVEEFSGISVPEPLQGFRLAATHPAYLLPLMQSSVGVAGPEYLSTTEDVQITQRIRDLALQLHESPVEIYNWVHNNIEYVPTYGSIQGSDLTLQTKQGNSFDISSLLIALLRASGTPARYVYGTIEVPIEKVMNWVGGVAAPNAALELLAQGGVPVTGLTQGGVIKSARLEHMWVEAFVDFFPSRGAKNRVPDQWIPMDASFKQHLFTTGMNSKERPPATELASINALQEKIAFDSLTGSVSGLTLSDINTVGAEARTKIKEYFNAEENLGHTPLREKSIDQANTPVLGAALPYRTVVLAYRASRIPSLAEREFRLRLYTSVTGQQQEIPALSFDANLSKLGNKRISVEYLPESSADADALRAFLPSIRNGSVLPAQLPSSLPGYLIRLVARLTVDGVEVTRVGGIVLGQELATSIEIQRHDGSWHSASNVVTAGEFMAVSLDLQGVGSDPLDWDQRLLPGPMLHMAARAYWSALDEQLKVLGGIGAAIAYRQPSFGVFSTALNTSYRYGIPREVQLKGVEVDVDGILTSVVAPDGNDGDRIRAVEQIGLFASLLESEIPQTYLSPTDKLGVAASTVSALAAAINSGQRIFEIDSSNVDAALLAIRHTDDIKSDIRRSVANGKRVVISETAVSIGSWQGGGYIIQDPLTGNGAYRISGGANGGSMDHEVGDALTVLGLGVLNVVIPPAAASSAAKACGDKGGDKLQINWELIIIAALLSAMLLAAVAGSGGAATPAVAKAFAILIPVVVVILAQPGTAQAAAGQCPTYYSGFLAGTGSIDQVTSHIASALSGTSPSVLTYLGVDVISEIVNLSWLNGTPQCNAAARAAYSASNGSIGACDEYPPAAVYEGGQFNYGPPNNYVSLRLIDFSQNSRAGGVMRWFFVKCKVFKNGQFEVRTTPGFTRGTDRDGAACYP